MPQFQSGKRWANVKSVATNLQINAFQRVQRNSKSLWTIVSCYPEPVTAPVI